MESDTVIAEYQVFWNRSAKYIMILQFPNQDRGHPYNSATHQKPLALRIKPRSGLVEVDVPINPAFNVDAAKAVRYGRALKTSRVLQQGGSFGLAGGLGVGGLPRLVKLEERAAEAAVEEPTEEEMLENYEGSVAQGRVLNKITHGGKIHRPKDGEPMYAIGVFRGGMVASLAHAQR